MKLDRIDIAILAILQEDGRITNKALADRVGLSARPCLERVRKLRAAGYIRRFAAVLEPAKFGSPLTVFAQISLISQERRSHERLEQHIKRIDEAVECFEVSGDIDFLVRFICPTLEAYYRLTEDLLANERLGIRRIDSIIVLRTVTPYRGLPSSLLSGFGLSNA